MVKNKLSDKIMHFLGNNLTSMIMFGSQANEKNQKFSDLDLLVIVKSYKKCLNLDEFLQKETKKEIDLYVLSEKDFADNLNPPSPLLATIAINNKIISDKNDFFSKKIAKVIQDVSKRNIIYIGKGGEIWEVSKIAKNIMTMQ